MASSPQRVYIFYDGTFKKIYLWTPMDRYEYIWLSLKLLLEEIIAQYGIRGVKHNECIYADMSKGIFCLPQAGIISNDCLTKNLETHGYHQCRHRAVLWKHKWRPVIFSLVVDGFGVKYIARQHSYHIIESIRKYYPVDFDWTGVL